MKKRTAGFSITELVVALALVTVVATMAAPEMAAMSKRGRITAATDSFVTSLQFARMQALKLNTPVQMVAVDGEDWARGWVVQTTASEVLRQVNELGGTVTLQGSGALFQFNAAGNLTSAADMVTICDDDQTGETGRQITIQAVGRVSNSKLTCS